MLRALTLSLAVWLGGCASGTPVPHKPIKIVAAKGPRTSTVYLNRASTWLWSKLDAHIFLDGKNIGTVRNGQCVRLTVPSGNHHLSVSPDQPFSGATTALAQTIASSLGLHNLKIKPGQTQFFYAYPELNPGGSFNMATERRPSGRKC